MGVALNQLIGDEKPASLQKYFERQVAAYKSVSRRSYREPSYVDIAGRSAVEAIEIIPGNEITMSSPPKIRSIETLYDSIVFEDRDAFYECWIQTDPSHYADKWHDYLHTFCNSIKFDAN